MTEVTWQGVVAQPTLDGCDLWTVDLDATRSDDALAVLCDDELARMGRFVFERDRLRFAASRAALRRLLGFGLDRDPRLLRFSTSAHGKPSLADDQELAFNVSHSGGSAIIAIDTARRHRSIGVDLELRREVRDALSLAQTCFDGEELDALAACDASLRDDVFLQGWTRKEACLKADGAGFSAGAIPSTGIDDSSRHVRLHDGNQAWLQSMQFPHAIAALAVVARGGSNGAPAPKGGR